MKIIETQKYVSVLRELTEEGRKVTMRIAGNSMSPFLVHERDYIRFEKANQELKAGDMVFYQRVNGQFIMHRVWKVKKDGYYMVGDAQVEIEGPIQKEQIFAKITQVKRKGKWIGPGDFWWEFFEHVWIRIVPFRRILRKFYGCMKGTKHEKDAF